MFVEIGRAAGVLEAHVSDHAGQAAPDAVVSLHAVDFTPPDDVGDAPHAVMDQRNRRFVPHVLAVRTGTLVDFPNSDDIRHQVYSFSDTKRFELPLYEGKPAKSVLFDQPGVVVLGCNIHDWMLGYIYVANTPYFGKTDAQGNVRIDALAPGRYQVQLWHPEAQAGEPPVVETVKIARTGETQRDYTLDLQASFPEISPMPSAGSAEDKFRRWRN